MDQPKDGKPPFGTFIPLAGPDTPVPPPKPLRFVFRDGYTYCIYPGTSTSYSTEIILPLAPADGSHHGDMALHGHRGPVSINAPTRIAVLHDRLAGDDVRTDRRPDTDIKPIILAANEGDHACSSMRTASTLPTPAEEASPVTQTDGSGHGDPEARSTALSEPQNLEVDIDAADISGDDGGDTTDDDDWQLEGLDALRKASKSTGAVSATLQKASSSNEVACYPADSVVGSPVDQGHDNIVVVARRQVSTASATAMDPHDALVRASLPSSGDDAAMARFEAERAFHVAKKQKQLERHAATKAARQKPAGKTVEASHNVPAKHHEPKVTSLSGKFSNGVSHDCSYLGHYTIIN